MVPAAKSAATITVRFRTAPKGDVSSVALAAAGPNILADAHPWREFRWRAGQKHYSGTYWSSTVGRHVIYESRLELARLLFADFDMSVRQIVAQPFLLRASIDRKPRKHIPDYLLITDTGPVVIDVKPARRLSDPKVAFTFEWTRELVEARGWRYEVATEPIAVELENLRFLAGYRRDWLFRPELLVQLREKKNLDGSPLADAFKCLPGEPIRHVKSAVLHLLWLQELLIDLSEPLGGRTELRRPA
ncbi:TnsA-like heteromeric transposase endonuclease subunit [Candidatus Mycobacterium methanotrophicum]|uniref:TnsA-like heteromeric transposase endonuclease subunit n=1 Tax=Candidatus Mycobacterium methanotrophicum TaxID=2943498 RepID=A0ABY4QL94_9MYCO|nr:TnsA-like heteromeric transposase endonuclease subunit [Candidatus Mycobacterium methanotrophicum]UQX10987.1 TnsA-like heteromeric transposase endonuclease subunit [Candidatus Mycobacterium methanotrophicum]